MFIEILESILDSSSDAIDADSLDSQASELEIFANEDDDKSYLIPPYDHFDKVPDWVLNTAAIACVGAVAVSLCWREES